MKTEWVYEVVTVVVTADEEKAKPTGVVFMESPEYVAPKPTQEAEKPKPKKEEKPKPKKEEKPASTPSPVTKETEKVTVVTVVAQSEDKEEQVYKQPEPVVVEKPKPVVEEPKTTVKKVVSKAAETTKAPEPTKAAEPKVVEASTPDLSLDGSYETVMLAYHNIHRANHSVSALEWDDELAGYAENTANGCVFEHDM